MPPLGPIKRRDLIAGLRKLGFSGPYAGGNHEFMQKGNTTLCIPNPHAGDISGPLLIRILRQAGVDRETWEAL
jgi:predicted RNA binding protein YcfA (HicA-like mRNA interferase family)